MLFAFQELTVNFCGKKYQRFLIFFFGLARRISYQNFAAHARKRGLSKLPREAFFQALSSRAVGFRDTNTPYSKMAANKLFLCLQVN